VATASQAAPNWMTTTPQTTPVIDSTSRGRMSRRNSWCVKAARTDMATTDGSQRSRGSPVVSATTRTATLPQSARIVVLPRWVGSDSRWGHPAAIATVVTSSAATSSGIPATAVVATSAARPRAAAAGTIRVTGRSVADGGARPTCPKTRRNMSTR
jgi:hypothetical protein